MVAPSPGHRQRHLSLQVEVLLAAHGEAVREPVRRPGERPLRLAAPQ